MKQAEIFMLRAIQEWGQSDHDRIEAVQGVLDAAGFDARATCWPVFGGIWPKPCEGKDGAEASKWLKDLTENLKRGRVQDEIQQISDAVTARLNAVA